jgi:uncharacterized protein (DUF111 family)
MIYFDCSAGISGDMVVGALVDLGADFDRIREALSKITEVKFQEVNKAGEDAKKFCGDYEVEKRDYLQILEDIDSLKVSDFVKNLSKSIIRHLGLGESKAHDVALWKVHLHEAADSIVDAVATAIAIEDLRLQEEEFVFSTISVGEVAPATAHIIRTNSIPTKESSEIEIATPTGLAIVAALAKRYSDERPSGREGRGAGDFDMPYPNVLRVIKDG